MLISYSEKLIALNQIVVCLCNETQKLTMKTLEQIKKQHDLVVAKRRELTEKAYQLTTLLNADEGGEGGLTRDEIKAHRRTIREHKKQMHDCESTSLILKWVMEI